MDTVCVDTTISSRGVRRAVIAGFAVAFLAVVSWWYCCVIIPYRVPPAWDECSYMHNALNMKDAVTNSFASVCAYVMSPEAGLCHKSGFAALCTLPVLAVAGVTYNSFFLASLLMCVAAAVLVMLIIAQAIGVGDAGVFGAVLGAAYFFLAPMVVACGSVYYAETPIVLATLLALFAYRWALSKQSAFCWLVASLLLFLSFFARAEKMIVFLPLMFLVHCVDELCMRGWKSGMSAALVYAGIGCATILSLQQWVPNYDVTGPVALMVNCGGVMFLVLWLGFVKRGGATVRRALWYGLPAVTLLVCWLLYNRNIGSLVWTLKWLGSANGVVKMTDLYLAHVPANFACIYCGSSLGAVLKAILLASGLYATYRRWPGLLVLLLLLYVQNIKLPDWTEARFMHQMYAVSAIVAGVGGATCVMWACMVVGKAVKRPLHLAACGFVAVCLCVGIMAHGTFERAWTTFEKGRLCFWIVFDKTPMLWEALQFMDDTLPEQCTVSMIPTILEGFDHETIQLHSRLKNKKWFALGTKIEKGVFQPTVKGLSMPDYVLVPDRGSRTSPPYFRRNDYVQMSKQTKIQITSNDLYRLVVSRELSSNSMTITAYKKQ